MKLFIVILMLSLLMECDLKKRFKKRSLCMDNRIVGGNPSTVGRHKFLVYLVELVEAAGGHAQIKPYPCNVAGTKKVCDAYFRCGGSIVATQWVLTAGHCIHGKDEAVEDRRFVIRANTSHSLPTTTTSYHPIIEYATPKCYRNKITYYDCNLAVVKVQKSLIGKDIGHIAVAKPDYEYEDCMTVTVFGWGGNKVNLESSYTVKELDTKIMPNNVCRIIARMTLWQLTKYMFCTTDPPHKGACTGDEGGPLIHKNLQIGVVSWNTKCGTGEPTVFTKLSEFSGWIAKKIGKKRYHRG